MSGPHTRSASRGSARSPSGESAVRPPSPASEDAADDERAHDEIEDLRARLLALDDDKSGLGTFFADALPGLPTDEELFAKSVVDLAMAGSVFVGVDSRLQQQLMRLCQPGGDKSAAAKKDIIGNIIKEKVVVFLARSLHEADDGGDAHDIVGTS